MPKFKQIRFIVTIIHQLVICRGSKIEYYDVRATPSSMHRSQKVLFLFTPTLTNLPVLSKNPNWLTDHFFFKKYMARAPFAFTLEARVDSKAISHNALSDHL